MYAASTPNSDGQFNDSAMNTARTRIGGIRNDSPIPHATPASHRLAVLQSRTGSSTTTPSCLAAPLHQPKCVRVVLENNVVRVLVAATRIQESCRASQ